MSDFQSPLLGSTGDEVKTSAVLVSVLLPHTDEHAVNVSLGELARLLDTAGGIVFATMIQAKQAPDVRTYIGRGKVQELCELCAAHQIPLVVFDCELSPSQIRNLEQELGGEVRVLDRSMLILDIFALHAVTGEGKLQVELAQLKYTVPRLIGLGKDLSKLGGGIGTRGPGESKLETDRRHLHRRMEALEAELAELRHNRQTQRKQRERSGLPKIAIAGYTNAGKSTLLNLLTDAGILAENKLFATLDPTTRKCTLPQGQVVLLTDTVGFIRNLPHHLIRAFSSTLEEVAFADLILVLCDASDPEYLSQLSVTQGLLSELNADGKPILYCLNKCDLLAAPPILPQGIAPENVVCISAQSGAGIGNLLARLEVLLQGDKTEEIFVIPNRDAAALNTLYTHAQVLDVEYGAQEMVVRAIADGKIRGMLARYLKNPPKKEEF